MDTVPVLVLARYRPGTRDTSAGVACVKSVACVQPVACACPGYWPGHWCPGYYGCRRAGTGTVSIAWTSKGLGVRVIFRTEKRSEVSEETFFTFSLRKKVRGFGTKVPYSLT
jgi:hypothetical protein